MRASDYRLQARQTLQGNWLLAVGVTLVASLLGGVGSSSFEFEFREDASQLPAIQDQMQSLTEEQVVIIASISIIVFLAALAYAFFVSNVINMGYHKFHMNMTDGILPEFKDLFSRFKKGVYMDTVKLAALRFLYIFGWSLLFVIPGIIAIYNYSMSYYVMLDHPELTPAQCLRVSKAMMKGNRWRLFCLEFSFIGWAILSALALGLGNLVLTPYTFSAQTAFYRSIRDSVDIQNYL